MPHGLGSVGEPRSEDGAALQHLGLAVFVALAIVLGDVLELAIGVAIGAGGIALMLAIGAAMIRLLGGPFSVLASGP